MTELSFGQYLAGCLLLAVTLGSAGASANVIVSRRLGHLRGVARFTGTALIGAAAVVADHLVPLTIGILTRATPTLCGLLLLAGVMLLVPRRSSNIAESASPLERRSPSSWVPAGVAATVLAATCAVFLETRLGVRPAFIDALGYHLPGIIQYIQRGSLWSYQELTPTFAHGTYPQNGDLLLLAFVLPWHSILLVRLVDPVIFGAALLALFGLGRELGASVGGAILAAGLFAVVRPVLIPAMDQVMTDPTFQFAFAAGLLFLARHWRTHQRSDLVLAGLGLGLAFGTKWYGLTAVPAAVAVWGVTWMFARRGYRPLLRALGVLTATIAGAGGFWLVRNWIMTGDPVFQTKVSVFGVTVFDAPPDALRARLGFSLAHYLDRPRILWHYGWPAFRDDFGLAGALLMASPIVVAATAARAHIGNRGIDARPLWFAALAVVLAMLYAVTPYSAFGPDGMPSLIVANTRYGIPALIPAVAVFGWLLSRAGRVRVVLEWIALGAVMLGLRDHMPVFGLRLLAVCVVLAGAVPVARHVPERRRRAAVAAACACLLLAVCAQAYRGQKISAAAGFQPADATLTYLESHPTSVHRVGIAGLVSAGGTTPQTALYGPHLENRVEYVGPDIAHLRHDYTTAAGFAAALRRGRFEYLEVGRGIPPVAQPHEADWARRAGYVAVAQSSRLILMRRGPAR